MTEHEKMLAGYLIYDPFTEGMPEERAKAHRLCKLYNDTFDTETEKREELLDELMPNRGENVYLQAPIKTQYIAFDQVRIEHRGEGKS